MKNWKDEFIEIERHFGYHVVRSWKKDIEKVQQFVVKQPDNVELNMQNVCDEIYINEK